jgi:hypothetical protein
VLVVEKVGGEWNNWGGGRKIYYVELDEHLSFVYTYNGFKWGTTRQRQTSSH